jgi:hypothetical protein
MAFGESCPEMEIISAREAGMTDDCPDPMQDYEGYLLWCECHPCGMCHGVGEIDCGDETVTVPCAACNGSGVDAPDYDTEEW